MKVKNYKIDDLIEAEYNPRQLTKDQHKQITDSIKRFGIVDPVIVNTHKERKNIIVGGHQRTKVAKELGHTEMPCVEVNLTPEKERERSPPEACLQRDHGRGSCSTATDTIYLSVFLRYINQ